LPRQSNDESKPLWEINMTINAVRGGNNWIIAGDGDVIYALNYLSPTRFEPQRSASLWSGWRTRVSSF